MNSSTNSQIADEVRLDIAAGILRCYPDVLAPFAKIASYDQVMFNGFSDSLLQTSIGSMLADVEEFNRGHRFGTFFKPIETVKIPVKMEDGWTTYLYPHTPEQRKAIEYLMKKAGVAG
jgi:hypothetical protein